MPLKDKFWKRLPGKNEILAVYAVSVFVLYGWTLFSSFWKIPSWLYYLKGNEIIAVYAYSLLVNFFESLSLVAALIVWGFILPPGLWVKQFVAKSALAVVVVVGSAVLRMYLFMSPELREDFVNRQVTWWGWTFLLGLTLSFLFGHVKKLRGWVEMFAERFVVFLYFYMPLTVIAFLVVLIRLVFQV